jgi:predicted nucleic acid-binding protein
MIGEFDLLIGSCAVYHDLVIVTSNKKHFDRIPNIRLEDWAQKSKFKK